MSPVLITSRLAGNGEALTAPFHHVRTADTFCLYVRVSSCALSTGHLGRPSDRQVCLYGSESSVTSGRLKQQLASPLAHWLHVTRYGAIMDAQFLRNALVDPRC